MDSGVTQTPDPQQIRLDGGLRKSTAYYCIFHYQQLYFDKT